MTSPGTGWINGHSLLANVGVSIVMGVIIVVNNGNIVINSGNIVVNNENMRVSIVMG